MLDFSTERDFFKTLLDNLYDGVYMTDEERKILYWNRAAERITGYSAGEVVGMHCWDNILVHVDEKGTRLCTHQCPAAATVADGRQREAQIYLHHKNGHRVPVNVRLSPIRDSSGAIRGVVEIFSEKDGRNAYLERIQELEELALLDPLTELGNRRYAEIQLQARLMEADRYGWSCGLMFVDIDHFKNVNDSYGHNVGDRVLRMVAMTLAENVRRFDTVSRWGGEEFVIMLANIRGPALRELAEKLRHLVEHSNIAFEGTNLSVTVSIGATLSLEEDSQADFVQRADRLMYMSKSTGRNRVTIG